MPAVALYQGNPSAPDSIEQGLFFSKENFVEVRTGYQGDFIFDADLKTIDGPSSDLHRFKGEFEQATLVFNILNQFEIFGLGGGIRAELKHRPSFDKIRRMTRTDFDWIWGGGARIIAFYWGPWTLGFNGVYQAANLPVSKMEVAGTTFSSKATWKVRRYQAGGGLSYRCGWIVPYIGGRWADVHDKLRHVPARYWPNDRFDLRPRSFLGATVGCGFYPGDYWSLNLEGRFIDETAFSLALDIKF